MDFIIVKSIHLASVFILISSLTAELVLYSPQMKRQTLKRISIIDAIYGLSSIIILITGFYIALSLGKGKDFYFDNAVLYIKLFLFILVGILSIYPTVYFLKNRKGNVDEIIVVPKVIYKIVYLEIIFVLLIPLFAVLLANGIHIL